MRLKSAYRTKLADNIPAETSTPDIPERVQASERAPVDFTTDNKAEPIVAIDAAIPEPDEATLALQKQLADLRKSEELQRQYALYVAAARAQPPTREQKLAMWRQQGLTEEDGGLLSEHPEMIDRDDLTRIAAGEAEQQGFERGTPQHRTATLEAFRRLRGQQAQAPASTTAFFEPPEAPRRSPAAPDRSAIVSAPVSRTAPSGETGLRPARAVRLTAEEQEYARIAGVSDVEYARMKQKLALHKANGDYGERR